MAIFNAGNAYLQILPSFRGIDSMMQREVGKLAKSIDKSISKGASDGLREAFDNIDTNGLSRKSKEAGDKWASTFESQVSSRLKDLSDKMPTFEPDADLSNVEKSLQRVKQRIDDLGKEKFSLGGGDLDKLQRELNDISATMEAIAERTSGDQRRQAQGVAAAAAELRDLSRQARTEGVDAGRVYGGAFSEQAKRAIGKALQDLPEIQLDADSSDVERRIAAVRTELVELGDKKIGIDIDRDRFAQDLVLITHQLNELTSHPQTITLQYDVDAAAKSLREFTDRSAGELLAHMDTEGRLAGDQWGGAYAETVQKRLESAIRSLPRLPVSIDDSQAARQLSAIRVQMQSLADKRINVDISATQAQAQIAALHERLNALDNDDVNIDIRTNAAAAAAQLALIHQEAEACDNSMRALGQNAGITMSRFGYLVAIGASLGSLVAPAAATAAVAVAGLGVAAAGALAGFGVLTLGLFGVADAVKKIDAYQQDANKSAKSFSAAQNQVVNATEAVRDAERNLANTRKDAADAQVEANRRIADAQRNVGKVQRDVADSIKDARQNESDAVKDLARTRADAQETIRRAVESEQDAERSATAAVKDQKKAREELNQAIRDAAQDLRDLQTEIKRNANDIDKATTAAMQAKEDLDKIMSNPRATEIERRQALEAYQDKVIQIEELKSKQTDLAKQQAAADKDGVESTDRVKKAREAVANADERAADAARRLANARKDVDKARLDATDRVAAAELRVAKAQAATQKAQRDGAERVADAQRQVADAQRAAAKQQEQAQRQILSQTEAVTKAQRQLKQASIAAGVAGGDAFDSMNDSLNKLSPAGQAFAKWLYSLKPELDRVRKTAQEGVLPGLQDSIQVLVDNYLPAFNRFVDKMARGLGNMFRATSATLLTPQWRQFFSFLDDNALPALQGMFTASLNVAHGIINIVQALYPLSKPIGQGLVQLTERFAKWSDDLQNNDGFQQFLNYAARVAPKVVQFIEDLVFFMGRLAVAAGPLGEMVLDILTNVVEFVNSWDIGTLSVVVDVVALLGTTIWALTGFVRAVRFATELWNAVTLIAARAQGLLNAALTAYRTATVGAIGSTGLLNGALFRAGAAGTTAAGGMQAATAAAGPLGLAIAGIGALWLISASQGREAQEQTDQLAQGLEELGAAYRKTGTSAIQGSQSVVDSLKKIAAQNDDLQRAVITLSQLGVSLDDIAAAASGSGAQLDQVLTTIDNRITQLRKNNLDEKKNKIRWPWEQTDSEKEIDRLEAMRDKFQEAADQSHLTTAAMKVLNSATADLSNTTAFLTPQQQALADANRVLADSSSTAGDKIDALAKAEDTMRQATIDASEAEEQFQSAQEQLTQSVNAAKKAHDADAKSLDVHTSTGRANRDMLENLIDSANRMYDADVALNGVTAASIKRGNDHITQIRNLAKQLGLNDTQTQNLINTYGKIPKSINTVVTMDPNSFQAVYKNLQRAQFMQMELRLGRDPSRAEEDWQEYQREIGRAVGKASGGPIVGPGTKTSDSVLIRASDGEFMQPAASVDYYGTGFMEAVRRRAIPRQMLPGFAGGGSISVKFPVNVSKTWVPTAEWIAANTAIPLGDGTFTGISSDASVAKLQKFALAQRGKRYLWAAVGPDEYDCSGLVGNLWALATGHALYHRYMSTADMGPGKHGMVGGPGKKMTVYLGPGHTAANVGGLHVEAYGGNGTPLAIGRIGTRLSYYTQRLHLPGFAAGGPVDENALRSKHGRLVSFLETGWPEPPAGSQYGSLLKQLISGGTYDTGGMLPPGFSTVFNGTGRPEAVLTHQQWQAIAELAGGGAGGNQYYFEFRDTTLDAGKLKAIQDREAALSRAGRSR